jgi:hypothetical protein
MQRHRPVKFAVSALLVAVLAATWPNGTAGAAEPVPPKGDGWESLFNGQDLTGWVAEGNDGHWQVIDGVIDCNPKAGRAVQLWSERELGDCVLNIEWRIKRTAGAPYAAKTILPDGSYKQDADGKVISIPIANADSGIYLRGLGKSQINIWCWPCGSGEIWGYRNDKSMPAEVRAGAVPKVKADHPVGEWNTFVITLKGDRVTVELNGKTVIENAQLPGLPEQGPIALQHHGGYNEKTDTWSPASSLVQFRNIWVKKLGE